ncbi:hypothetical protein ABPG77_008702 [Micractinium sp. CCAP 211/92]
MECCGPRSSCGCLERHIRIRAGSVYGVGSGSSAASSATAQALAAGSASARAAAAAAAQAILSAPAPKPAAAAASASAAAAAAAKAPSPAPKAVIQTWCTALSSAICQAPESAGNALAVAFSDALAYDASTCRSSCEVSAFAKATVQALSDAIQQCGCAQPAVALAQAVAELGPHQAPAFLQALSAAAAAAGITLPPCIFPISCVYLAPVAVASACKQTIPVVLARCSVQPKVIIICGKAGLPVTLQQATPPPPAVTNPPPPPAAYPPPPPPSSASDSSSASEASTSSLPAVALSALPTLP